MQLIGGQYGVKAQGPRFEACWVARVGSTVHSLLFSFLPSHPEPGHFCPSGEIYGNWCGRLAGHFTDPPIRSPSSLTRNGAKAVYPNSSTAIAVRRTPRVRSAAALTSGSLSCRAESSTSRAAPLRSKCTSARTALRRTRGSILRHKVRTFSNAVASSIAPIESNSVKT